MEGLKGVLKSKCTYTAAAMYPFVAVNTDTDVNISPLSLIETSNVFKVEDVMKQFERKTTSLVSPSLLFHLYYLQPTLSLAGCCVKM